MASTGGFQWNEPVLSPTEAKRQHYVPRSYLRSFAGPSELMRVADMTQGRDYRTSLTNVAVEGNFYDLHREESAGSAEEWLANVEDLAMPVIRRLLHEPGSIESLAVEEQIAIARFIASLRFRTPAFRNQQDSIVEHLVLRSKELMKNHLIHEHGETKGNQKFNKLRDKPLNWWLGEEKEQQPAETSIYMLQETQGFANLILGAPWRIGYAKGTRRLYTSDNPVSGYPRLARPWDPWAFASLEYYLPLSPDVLLKIERRPDRPLGAPVNILGQRRKSDFSEWEASLARHIVTFGATTYLYGEGIVVPRECAHACLHQLALAMLQVTEDYLGVNPHPTPPLFPSTS